VGLYLPAATHIWSPSFAASIAACRLVKASSQLLPSWVPVASRFTWMTRCAHVTVTSSVYINIREDLSKFFIIIQLLVKYRAYYLPISLSSFSCVLLYL